MKTPKYQTDWTPQFGSPVLPPTGPSRKKKGSGRGSWERPSKNMISAEMAKCRITRTNLETGEILSVQEPMSHAQPKKYGSTGRHPQKKSR